MSWEQAGLTPAFTPQRIVPLIEAVGDFFASAGIEAYLVGGSVRDALIGRDTRDVDIAISADARAVSQGLAEKLGGHFFPLDEERGVVRIVVRQAHHERVRQAHHERSPMYIDLSEMHGGIAADLARRDFTIDALALPLADAAAGDWSGLLDPFGGVNDLRDRVIRQTASAVFAEDPARLLRAARLAARLGFTIDAQTRRQIRQDARLVASIAPERVRDELLLTLEQTGVTETLRGMDELGLLCEVIPELSDARGVTQPREHYWDVFNHLVETAGQVERLLEAQPGCGDYVVDMLPGFASMEQHFAEEVTDDHSRLTLLKLAGLLHDISKPATRTVEPSGRIRFLGHDSEGAVAAGRIMRRLRFSRRGVKLMKHMVDNHLRPRQMSQKGELPSRRAIYRYYRDLGDAAIDTLYLNAADYLAARGPMLTQEEWAAHCALMDYILNQGAETSAPQSLPKLITGKDIIEEFSVEPGPRIGELLDAVREAQASGEISTREEALEMVGNSLNSGGGGA